MDITLNITTAHTAEQGWRTDMNNDLISRQAAIDVVHRAIYDFFDICSDDDESPITYKDEKLLEINKAITTQICKLPSAQPERKKGKWIYEGARGRFPACRCSVCGNVENADWAMISGEVNYCPHCGADMRGKEP
jgi:hypothetical protein